MVLHCIASSKIRKTPENLSIYSRKLGNYNGTIDFEIDMKNSSPLNSHFLPIPDQNNSSFLLDSQHSQLSFTVSNSGSKQKKQPKKLCKSQV